MFTHFNLAAISQKLSTFPGLFEAKSISKYVKWASSGSFSTEEVTNLTKNVFGKMTFHVWNLQLATMVALYSGNGLQMAGICGIQLNAY